MADPPRAPTGATAAAAATYAVLALTMADNTMVGVAVPRIRGDFHVGVASLQWVVAGYIVAFAGLLFTGGALGDRYGRKKALLGGVAVFAAGAVVAATASDWRVLVAGRVVQGVGAAASEPGTLSLVRQLFPDDRRRLQVLGGWAAASGVALAAGPVAAGLLVALGGWRAVFAGEAVAAVAAGLVASRRLVDSRDPGSGRDLTGQVSVALALSATVFALIDGQERGFLAPREVLAWVVAAASLSVFVAVERRRREPVLDLRILRDRLVAAGLLSAAASTFALFSVLLLVSLDLQVVGGYSGLATAGAFTPMTLAMVAAGPLGGRWGQRFGVGATLAAGLAVAAAALGALDASLGKPVNPWATTSTLTVLGLGVGLVVAPTVASVLARVPAARSGMAAAAVTAGREIGGVVGITVLGAILSARLITGLTGRLIDLGIPTSYRSIVLDAIRKGAPVPTSPPPQHGSFFAQLLAQAKQSVIDSTVEAGKAAYVDSVRSALLVAVGVLVAAGVAVAVLTRHAPADVGDTPTAVGGRC